MSAQRTILALEDNAERILAFEKAVSQLGESYELRIWRDAYSMCAECETFLPTAVLISLDHDLNPAPGVTADPGTGLDVAKFLGDFLPACPVLLHSSNTDRAYSMHNELRFAGWTVDRVGPLGSRWVETSWLPRVRDILSKYPNTWKAELPPDHSARVERMMVSLDGLSIGDALGEMFAYRPKTAPERLKRNELPAGPWFHTDDTEMAISIAAVLKSHGRVEQDALAKRFARRWEREPDRGYGGMTRMQMREMLAGENWRATSARAFGGQGSKGNGGAMRVAPLGAYFADDLNRVVREAQASSVVTHVHPEGVAGTVATALAAAMAWQLLSGEPAERASRLFDAVLQLTQESEVRRKILLASQMPPDTEPEQAAKALGLGLMAGLFGHTLLDLSNTFGVAWFMPFSRRRFCLEWVFFIDEVILAAVTFGLTQVVPRILRDEQVPLGYAAAVLAFFFVYVLGKGMLRRRAGKFCPTGNLVPSALVPWRFFGTARESGAITLFRANALTGTQASVAKVPLLDESSARMLEVLPEFRLMREVSPEYHVVGASAEGTETRLLCRDMRTRNFGSRFGDLEVWLDANRRIIRSRFHA